MEREAAIRVHGLRKSYGDFEAVRGIDFEVYPGEVFGLLGPNGAGKTTTVEILEGIRYRTGGEAMVLGLDPSVATNQLKDRIGVALQSTVLPDKLKVREAIELFASLYSRQVQAKQLLEMLQLTEKAESFYSTLSGGQKQRLAIALAMVNEPMVVFLDEPTTGLDAQVRLEIHGLIEKMKAEHRTVLLTTHYIEEAEKLCDRVAIVDEGRIIETGTPRELRARAAGQSKIEIELAEALDGQTVPELAGLLSVQVKGKLLIAQSGQPTRTLVELLRWIDSLGVEVVDIHLAKPTLEDVFLELTGKKLRE